MPDERKTVTALFADVVGSTAMGSERDPELARYARRQRDWGVNGHPGSFSGHRLGSPTSRDARLTLPI